MFISFFSQNLLKVSVKISVKILDEMSGKRYSLNNGKRKMFLITICCNQYQICWTMDNSIPDRIEGQYYFFVLIQPYSCSG